MHMYIYIYMYQCVLYTYIYIHMFFLGWGSTRPYSPVLAAAGAEDIPGQRGAPLRILTADSNKLENAGP